MSSPRWLIGLMMLFIICTIISNVIENQGFITAGQMSDLEAMAPRQIIETKDPDTGAGVTTGNNVLAVWQSIWKALWFDYSFFYEDDGVTPNDWMIIRYIFFWPMTVGLLIEIIMAIRRFISGG